MVAAIQNQFSQTVSVLPIVFIETGKIVVRLLDSFVDRLRISQGGILNSHRHHRATVHIHRVLDLVRQMGATILHLGNSSIRVLWVLPIVVRALLGSLLVDLRSVFAGRSGDS